MTMRRARAAALFTALLLTAAPGMAGGRAQAGQGARPVELAEGRGRCCRPRSSKHYKSGEYVEPDRRLAGRQVQLAARLQGRHRDERGQVQGRRRGHIIDKATGKQPPYIIGYPFPTIDAERSAGGGEDRVELLLPHLVLRQPARASRRSTGSARPASSGASTQDVASSTTTASRRTTAGRTRRTSASSSSSWRSRRPT